MPDLSPADKERDEAWAARNAALFRAANDESRPEKERLKLALAYAQAEIERFLWRDEARRNG